MSDDVKAAITQLPDIERDKLTAEVNRFRRIALLLIENEEIMVMIRSYQAHVKAGFTPEQALELCGK